MYIPVKINIPPSLWKIIFFTLIKNLFFILFFKFFVINHKPLDTIANLKNQSKLLTFHTRRSCYHPQIVRVHAVLTDSQPCFFFFFVVSDTVIFLLFLLTIHLMLCCVLAGSFRRIGNMFQPLLSTIWLVTPQMHIYNQCGEPNLHNFLPPSGSAILFPIRILMANLNLNWRWSRI